MSRLAAAATALCLTAFAAATEPMLPSTPMRSLCGRDDRVVWLDTQARTYSLKGDPAYGRGEGRFTCQGAADREGDQATIVDGRD